MYLTVNPNYKNHKLSFIYSYIHQNPIWNRSKDTLPSRYGKYRYSPMKPKTYHYPDLHGNIYTRYIERIKIESVV